MTGAPAGRPGVLLDIDGTLLDTNYLHALAWWRSFRALGRTYPVERIHRLIGMGGDKLVPELAGRPVEGAEDGWRREFERLLPEVTLLPGARRFVQVLHERGVAVVLASSAPQDHVEHFRSVLDVDDWLVGATSSDDADGSKPDADIFTVALDRFGLEPADALVVGDSVWNARAARKAGVDFIGVETGGTDGRTLRDEGARAVYPDVGRAADRLGTEDDGRV